MATADLRADTAPPERGAHSRSAGAQRRKPPLPLRPIHKIWRRTLDNIELTRHRLPTRNLPDGLEGLTACQISDFHVDREEDLHRLERALALVNRQHPDLVFLTGDYFSGPQTMRRYVAPVIRALAELKPAHGIFAIPGNHDHWASFDGIAEGLRAAGADVLSNHSTHIQVRGERLVIVGIDDLWARRAEPSRAFKTVRADDCTVVLAHNPDTALYTRHLKPGVMLSGHTHGGVVRLPFYGAPLKSFLRLGKEYYAGLNPYDDFYIYTNRGLGTFWVRLRINCRPEVSHFQLTLLEAAARGSHKHNGHPAQSHR